MNSKFNICFAMTLMAMAGQALAHGDEAAHEKITPAFRHALPNAPGKVISSVVVEYQPGQKSLPHRHGSAEFIYILSGRLVVDVEGEQTMLEGGDAMYFDSSVPHSYQRDGTGACTALVVTTPGAPESSVSLRQPTS